MQNNLQFKKVRDFGEIINDTFVFIKQNFKPLIKVFFYLCGLFLLGGALSTIMHQLNLVNTGSTRLSAIFTLQGILAIIFAALNYAALAVTILSFIALYVENGNVAPKVEQVWAYFKYYFFRVLFSNILLGMILIGSFLLLIIPFFYVFPAMSLLLPIMVLENGTFGYSFRKSFKLLTNQWWVTAGTMLVIWIITYALMLAVSIPGVLLSLTSTFVPKSMVPGSLAIVVTTVLQHLSHVLMIIPMVGVTFCYFNLAERQENSGLFDRINQLGGTDDKPVQAEEY
jgi:hypothetical protein